MAVRIAVVDDEPEVSAFLAEGSRECLQKAGLKGEVQIFSSAEAFLEEGKDASIVLLDIQMEGMDGMTCAGRMREDGSKALIIFVTSMASYAVQGYKVDALDYIVKPVGLAQLSLSLNKAFGRLRAQRPKTVSFRSPGGITLLKAEDILYVEALNHSAVVHTRKKDVPCALTLSAVEEMVAGYGFFRCHAAFLVNLAKIEGVRASDAVVEGRLIPVSKHRRKALMQELTAWWGSQL